MPAWLLWLIVAAVLVGAEALSLDLVLIMLAGGAAAAAIMATFAPPLLQVIVGLVVATGLLVGVRPVAQRHLNAHPSTATGAAALVGKSAVVLERVDARGGLVRLNGGHWSARSFDQHQIIPAGSTVSVMEIDGATAVVWDGP